MISNLSSQPYSTEAVVPQSSALEHAGQSATAVAALNLVATTVEIRSSGPPLSPSPASDARQFQRAGDLAYIAIQSNFQAAIQRRRGVLADRDPEELHQMRVSLRRLQTAVEAFAPVTKLPKQLGDRPIAAMAKTLGLVRDVDVLQAWFADYGQQHEPTQSEVKVLAKLHRHLLKRRKQAMVSVDELLHSPGYLQFVVEAQAWLQSPQYRSASQLPMVFLLPDLMLPLMSQVLLHPGWLVATALVDGQLRPQMELSAKALAKVLRRQGDDLHDLRKQVKRLRYQAELLQDHLGEGYGDRIEEFKAIQAVLGAFQDEVVLTRVLQRKFGSQWVDKLPRLEKYFRAQHQLRWQQWQGLQHQYLDLGFRRQVRRQIVDLL